MTGPEGCRQEGAPSAEPRRSASAARRHIAQTHYRRAVRRKRRGCGSAPVRTAFGACRRGGCSDCRPAMAGGVDTGGGTGLAAGCGPPAAVRANSGGPIQRRNRPRRAPDGLIAGGSAARRLGGSAARRLGGSAARRLGGSAAHFNHLTRRQCQEPPQGSGAATERLDEIAASHGIPAGQRPGQHACHGSPKPLPTPKKPPSA